MSDLLFDRERAALNDFSAANRGRRAGEDELTVDAARLETEAVAAGEKARRALANKHEQELAELDAAAEKEQNELTGRNVVEDAEAQQELADARSHLETEEKGGRSAARRR